VAQTPAGKEAGRERRPKPTAPAQASPAQASPAQASPAKATPATAPAQAAAAPAPAAPTPAPQDEYLTGRKIGTWFLQHRFYFVDQNGDELLGKEEFEYFSDEFSYYQEAKNFRVADRNGDLHISPNELRNALDEELIYRRVQEKIEMGDLSRKYPALVTPTADFLKSQPEIAATLLGNFLWMSEHPDLVKALIEDKGWLNKQEKALFTLHKNLYWLASNPRKAEQLYKNPKVKKALPKLELWRKEHAEFIRDNGIELSDVFYALQLFDRERVELDNSDFSPLDSTQANVAMDSLTARLRHAREENANLTIELALLRDQSRQEQLKQQDRISALEKQLSAIQTDMSRTELERNKLTDQLLVQSESMRKLAIEKERQRATISAQGQQIASLSNAKDTLSTSLLSARSQNASLTASLGSQRNMVDTLQRKLNSESANNIRAKAQIEGLSANIKAANTRMDSLIKSTQQMDAERRVALEQATGLELALKGAEEELASSNVAQTRDDARVSDRLAENVRQREQIARLTTARDSLTREMQRLEVEKNALADRESRNRLAATAQAANVPQQPAAAVSAAAAAELDAAKKRITQMERDRVSLEDQIESNVRFIQAFSAEKEQLEAAVRELKAQNKSFDTANDSLSRILANSQGTDATARIARAARTSDSLRVVLKKAQEESQKTAASNKSLQEQMNRKNESDASLEQQRGELIAREQLVDQRTTIIAQRENTVKAQEERMKALDVKERELKQLEQRLKAQQETLARTPNVPAVAASNPTPAPTTASPTTKPAATASSATPNATRDANGAAVVDVKNANQQRIAVAAAEDLAKCMTYFDQKGLQPTMDGGKLVYDNILIPEIGSDTYGVQLYLAAGTTAAEKTLVITIQNSQGEYLTEDKYPVEALKTKILFKRIYR